jgi:hypothetical protein
MAERIENGGLSGDIGCVPEALAARTRARSRAPNSWRLWPSRRAREIFKIRANELLKTGIVQHVQRVGMMGLGACGKREISTNRLLESEIPSHDQ